MSFNSLVGFKEVEWYGQDQLLKGQTWCLAALYLIIVQSGWLKTLNSTSSPSLIIHYRPMRVLILLISTNESRAFGLITSQCGRAVWPHSSRCSSPSSPPTSNSETLRAPPSALWKLKIVSKQVQKFRWAPSWVWVENGIYGSIVGENCHGNILFMTTWTEND